MVTLNILKHISLLNLMITQPHAKSRRNATLNILDMAYMFHRVSGILVDNLMPTYECQ